MSAIAGIVGRGSLPQVRNMLARMSYRGSNQRAWSPAPDIYFGEVGHDVGSDNEVAIAATTRLASLTNARYDAETLAGFLSTDAAATLRSLPWNFAIAAVNLERPGSVLLAVDQSSYKSLFVMRLPDRWIFATEYKALLALDDCPAEADREALQYYVRHGKCGRGRSLLAGVKCLSGGEMLLLGSGSETIESYLDGGLIRTVGAQPCSPARMRAQLESVVARQLEGLSRVGITLSGGFDSTALVALIRHVRPDIQIASFTIGYGEHDPEIIGARRSADYFKTEHQEVFFDNSHLGHLLPRYVWLTEDLAGRGEAILAQEIDKRAGESSRVVFAGHAADMLFCGMPRHRLLWIADRSPTPIKNALREMFVYTQLRRVPPSGLGRLLARLSAGESPTEGVAILGANTPDWSVPHLSLRGYRSAYWASATFRYHEPAVAEHGAIMFSPFTNPELRNLALGVKDSIHVNARRQKLLLRQSVADLLPDDLLKRPKAIQKLRRDDDLSTGMRHMAIELDLDQSLASRGLIAKNTVASLLQGRNGRQTKANWNDLWGLICVEIWMRIFHDRRGAPVPAELPPGSYGRPYCR